MKISFNLHNLLANVSVYCTQTIFPVLNVCLMKPTTYDTNNVFTVKLLYSYFFEDCIEQQYNRVQLYVCLLLLCLLKTVQFVFVMDFWKASKTHQVENTIL